MPLPPTLPPRSPPSPPQRPFQQSPSSSRHHITHGRRTRWHGTHCGRKGDDDCIFRVLDASPTRSMGRGCFGISTGEVGGGKERFYMAVFALFRWYVFFFLLSPPNRMKYAYAYSHRPDQDMTSGTFSFFSDTFSPTYLPTYLLYPFFSPFIRSPSLSRPAIRSRRSKLCNNTHPPNLRRHCTRRRDGNVSVA